MSKLYKFREWLTLSEAAKHLSGVCEEEVSVSDVLRLALDGHLKISANFVNGVLARRGKLVSFDEAFPPEELKIPLVQRLAECEGFHGVALNGDLALDLSEPNSTFLTGVIDLSMLGAEIHDLEHQFQKLTGGADVTVPSPEGVVVTDSAGDTFQLQASPEDWKEAFSTDYHEPLEGLPDDAVLVVRTTSLREFENSLIGDSSGTLAPLSSSERQVLLKQIGALSLALAEQAKKYKRAETPNALQIAIAMGEIIDALPNANTKGVGASSIRESIRKGIELLTAVQS